MKLREQRSSHQMQLALTILSLSTTEQGHTEATKCVSHAVIRPLGQRSRTALTIPGDTSIKGDFLKPIRRNRKHNTLPLAARELMKNQSRQHKGKPPAMPLPHESDKHAHFQPQRPFLDSYDRTASSSSQGPTSTLRHTSQHAWNTAHA